MITLLTLFAAHSQDDWEYDNLMEGLDQQEAYCGVESVTDAVSDDGEAGTRVVLSVRYREDYQLDNVREEIDQSEASAWIEEERLTDPSVPAADDYDFPSA